MKCAYCGGSMIFDQGHSLDPARLKCLSCGREERMPEEQKNEETKKLCSVCGKPTYQGHHHGRSEDNPRKDHRNVQGPPPDDHPPPRQTGKEEATPGRQEPGQTNVETAPKRKYTRHAKPEKKKNLPAVRRQETMPEKTTVMFKALRRAIILDFLEEIRGQL